MLGGPRRLRGILGAPFTQAVHRGQTYAGFYFHIAVNTTDDSHMKENGVHAGILPFQFFFFFFFLNKCQITIFNQINLCTFL